MHCGYLVGEQFTRGNSSSKGTEEKNDAIQGPGGGYMRAAWVTERNEAFTLRK